MLSTYWNESARPLVALAFVGPMILVYESGLFVLGPQAMRNGADVWLRDLLSSLGFAQYFLLPCLPCSTLLGWHHLNRERWKIHWSALYGMLLEAMLFGFVLLVLARALTGFLAAAAVPSGPQLAFQSAGQFGHIVTFLGAGIYEELVFRLMLFPALAALLRLVGTPRRTSWVVSLFLSSLLFAAAHYQLDLLIGSHHLVTTVGDSFEWTSFLFRTAAGVFFATLFLARGFGVAAGAHAFYDILVSMI
jgi:membrane protease YdiL (CAAX protease family)